MRCSLLAVSAALVAGVTAAPGGCPYLAARDEAGRQLARRQLSAFGDHPTSTVVVEAAPDQAVPTSNGPAAQATQAGFATVVRTGLAQPSNTQRSTTTSILPDGSRSNPLADTLGGILGAIGPVPDLLKGLVGGLAQNVNPNDLRPDAAHPFQSPGVTDQRGPCLNLLANHGYLPRTGIVTAGQVIEATAEVFNFSPDLSTLLAVVAVAFTGNIETETWSLGGEDERTYSQSGIGSKAAGRQFGLDAHSRCEGDISPTREDFYTHNGDNHNGSPRLFQRFTELAKQNGNEYGLAAVNALYGANARESVANNPRLFFNSYTIVVILGAYPFIPAFMSNGTYGAGGVANYDSIGSIMGYKSDGQGGFCYVPERLPENWYRRSTLYSTVNLIAGLPGTYLSGPVLPNPVSILQNLDQVSNIGCALYQGLTSGIPASLLGSTNERISAVSTYVENKLLAGFPHIYGCQTSAGLGLGNTTTDTTGDVLQATGPGGDQRYGTCGASA